MLKNITLEVSLKPFKKTERTFIKQVCRQIFEQWKPLIKNVESVSIMLWSADGSELLDYKGNLDDVFEWAYFIGGANPREGEHPDIDPEGLGLHTRNYLYMDNPPVMTYRILQDIVSTLKEIGSEFFPGKEIRVGTTFDPGPEFAVSSFKYERHNEICLGNDMGHATMVCAYAKLKGDNISYAAYPEGIPEGLPFGTFLGKQAQIFMSDMGFDFIWLSNGVGFGRETWSTCGAIFDGEKFDCAELEGVKKDVLDFWNYFRKECPDYPIEVRGTNMSMGIDMATDGVPLKTIYDSVTDILPPPNSPWAALNRDFGLELMGHMSRIAKVPNEEYLYRFYIHDIWWMNSPWYDRYNGLPHDIYLPLSIARIDEKGLVKLPTHMNILSIDNSFGNMPDACVNEPLPHLLKAIKEMPDEVAPVVWVYPFDEYSECTDAVGIQEMFAGDWFIRGAMNSGLPLSMVVSTDNFVKHDKKIYAGSILVTPVPQKDSVFEAEVLQFIQNGGRVIFYGNTLRAGERFLQFMGIRNQKGIAGELEILVDGEKSGVLKHNALISGGEIYSEADHAFAQAGEKALCVVKGNAVWMRGTVSCEYVKGMQLLQPDDPEKYFISETLMTKALGKLGYQIIYEKSAHEKAPVMTIHRYDNAFVFSAFLASTTVKTKFKFPLGAPVLDAYETVLEEGYAVYHFPKAERKECRVFVEQNEGIVGCRELPPVSMQYRRRIEVFGLQNATVRFLPEKYCEKNVTAVVNSHVDYYFVGDAFEGRYVTEHNITYYEVKNITGSIVFSMPFGK